MPLRIPGGLHPHAHAHSSLLQVPIEPLCFSITVVQSPFAALTCFLIEKSYLLKARVIIHAYNEHVPLLPPEPGSSTTTVYLGRGSRHCYEIKWNSLSESRRHLSVYPTCQTSEG